MNKKAVIWEELADLLLGGAILFIAITSYMLITGIHEVKVSEYVQEKTEDISQDEILISYLHAHAEKNNTIEDLIVLSKINNVDVASESIDELFIEIYSKKVCWVLSIDGKEWLKKNKCKKGETILDGNVISSFPDKTVHKIGLRIKGYADE